MEKLKRFCHFGGSQWIARAARPGDRGSWEELFGGYCDFYERPSTPEQRSRVWSWIGSGTVICLLTVPAGDPEGRAVGLAHLRPYPSPLRGSMNGYLDDLFVAPAARGTGAFETLFTAIAELAAGEGWGSVRWITAADNDRARAAYDRVSVPTAWVTYQLDV